MTWWLPSTPDTMTPYPWLHPAAVCYLESLLTKDMTVIEHGCGGSTLWFASRVKQVYCIDDDMDWVEAVMRRYFANVIPLIGNGDVFNRDKPSDLLFVDGKSVDRPRWMGLAPEIVKRGGVVILDNAERPAYKEARQELAKHCHPPTVITAWTGTGKMVITEFYRLRGGVNWI